MNSPLVKKLQEATGLGEAQILRLITRSPHTYKVYSIPKKTGGTRTIAQPARETKYIQRWLISNLFCYLPVHKASTAYRENSSIKDNAVAHSKNPYISKFDFENFFPSIRETDLIQHFSRHLGTRITEEDIRRAARLCSFAHKGVKERGLSIGAPSSPLLSNSIMHDFDTAIDIWCMENNVIYTRYADDLTFSTKVKGISLLIESNLRKVLAELAYPKLDLNNKKTTHISKKFQRRITGVIINNEGNLSIGRERKRIISALIHRYVTNALEKEEIYHLQGLLGFATDIEPSFVSSMRKKYSSKTIEAILQIRKEAQNKNQS